MILQRGGGVLIDFFLPEEGFQKQKKKGSVYTSK